MRIRITSNEVYYYDKFLNKNLKRRANEFIIGETFEIYGIILSDEHVDSYYVAFNGKLHEVLISMFEVIDNTIPKDWIVTSRSFNNLPSIIMGPERFVNDDQWRYDLITFRIRVS